MRVRLTVTQDELEVRAEVTDTGPGIAPGDQKRLFKAFVQLRDPGSEGYHGTGLGLTLTKQLAELHGG
ncbi:ATP-binding protein, partial [Klebsiella pneumoniae]|uniref:ATP-binding protein n=1 Tax=Klebsiella pneumoniae TaxID=573 RepID=UPI0027D34853